MYRWVEHMAEVELSIEAPTQEAVFAEAAAAFTELVEDGRSGDPVQRRIELEARDRGELLADWLEELVYLADTEGFVPEPLAELDLEEGKPSATVLGHGGEPRPIVKAITRYDLTFEPAAGSHDGWHARVVLDV